jgi:hypothetical protein
MTGRQVIVIVKTGSNATLLLVRDAVKGYAYPKIKSNRIHRIEYTERLLASPQYDMSP